jgi:hypothetical protein
MCWGTAGMVRTGHDFTDRETDFLAAEPPAIASATRLAVRSEARRLMPGGQPAIVVVGPRGELRADNPAADGQSCRPAPLIGGDDDQVAVAIEPASGDQLLGLLPVAYGLISRERDLCREVINGRSTSEIPWSDVPFE